MGVFIDSIKLIIENFPKVDTEKLVSDVLEAFFSPLRGFLRPKLVFSAEIGFTWIPFYGYETFLGLMLQPCSLYIDLVFHKLVV